MADSPNTVNVANSAARLEEIGVGTRRAAPSRRARRRGPRLLPGGRAAGLQRGSSAAPGADVLTRPARSPRPVADEVSPFLGLEKAAVLQDARCFNDSQLDARRCQQARSGRGAARKSKRRVALNVAPRSRARLRPACAR